MLGCKVAHCFYNTGQQYEPLLRPYTNQGLLLLRENIESLIPCLLLFSYTVLWNLFHKIDTTEVFCHYLVYTTINWLFVTVLIQQLQSYSLEQLNDLWDEITDQTAIRIGCIKTLDAELSSIEQDRIKMVSVNQHVTSIV